MPPIRIAAPLLAAALAVAPARASARQIPPPLDACGDYQINGRLECSDYECTLWLWSGSLSERPFHFRKNEWLNGDPDHGTITVRARIRSRFPGKDGYEATALSFAERALPDDSTSALLLLKRRPCARRR